MTMRQLAPLLGISKSAADRVIDQLGPSLVLQPQKRFAKDTALIVDSTLVPTRADQIATRLFIPVHPLSLFFVFGGLRLGRAGP